MKNKKDKLQPIKKRLEWSDIDLDRLITLLQVCLEEELGTQFITRKTDGDITSRAAKIEGSGTAKLIAREKMTCCGMDIAPLVFKIFETKSLHFEKIKNDGERVEENQEIAVLSGKKSEILLVERTLLNFIQKLSGISTFTSILYSKIESSGVSLLDTRKTTPAWRHLEKFATACGGAYNHRQGLFDRILIKDNHLASRNVFNEKDFHKFIKSVRKENPDTFIQVEIDKASYCKYLEPNDVDGVLLDNFRPDELPHLIKEINSEIITEISGCVNAQNIESYARCKPDFISTGAPTHSSRWVDIGLDWS